MEKKHKNGDQRSALGVQRSEIRKNWKSAWQIDSFKIKFFIGMLLLLGILIYFPFFFKEIEGRNGCVLPDILLSALSPRDASMPIFILIWASGLLLVYRLISDPDLYLTFLWGYVLLTLMRMTCIGLISLNPPAGLIPLEDPLTNLFYGTHYITHDLFFSGHTATICLIFFCLKRKADKRFTGLATILTGGLLLFQHVHYTIDVLAAPLFTYAAYRCVLFFTRKERRALTGP